MKGPGQGKTNNPAGRPAGIPNKMNKFLREEIFNFVTDNFPIVQDDFRKLQPRERVKFYIDLLSYCLPRLESISINELGLETLTDEQLDQIINKLNSGYENGENKRDNGTT